MSTVSDLVEWTIISLRHRTGEGILLQIGNYRWNCREYAQRTKSLAFPVQRACPCIRRCTPVARESCRPIIYAPLLSKGATLKVAPIHALDHIIGKVVIRNVPTGILEQCQCDPRYGNIPARSLCLYYSGSHEFTHEDPLLPMRTKYRALCEALILELSSVQRWTTEMFLHFLDHLRRLKLEHTRGRAKAKHRHEAIRAHGDVASAQRTQTIIDTALVIIADHALCDEIDMDTVASIIWIPPFLSR